MEAGDRWEAFLDPNILRGKLISASLYMTAYELLKESIVGRIETFFFAGFNEDGPRQSPEYEKEVLSRSRSRLYASLSWLHENGAIDDADLTAFETIKACRNQLAHELSGIVAGSGTAVYLEQFPVLGALLRKIEVWWIVNVEIPINPDFADAEIDEGGIVRGPLISLQVMTEIALADPQEARKYLDEFRKRGHKYNGEKT